MTFFGFMTAAGNRIRFDEPNTWWALALVVFLGLSTGYVCERAAIAQLTFDADNRTTGIRLATGTVALLLDRPADISHRTPAAADVFRRVDRHFDADSDANHGSGAVVRRPRPILCRGASAAACPAHAL